MMKKEKNGDVKTDLFINTIMGMKFVLLVFGSIIAIAVVIFIGLALFEWIAPDTVHVLNYKLTASSFEELKSNGHYHQAISLLESNSGILESEEALVYRTEQADCYFHVGDYRKAEELYLKNYEESDEDSGELKKHISAFPQIVQNGFISMMKFLAARDLFKIYENTGDVGQQRKYFEIMEMQKRGCCEFQNFIIPVPDRYLIDSRVVDQLFAYDSIRMKYVDDPMGAIQDLERFVGSMIDEGMRDDNSVFSLRLLNKLVSWKLEQEKMTEAYPDIQNAINIANSIGYRIRGDFSGLGDLSDYCFLTHDNQAGEEFMRLYLEYLEDTYDKEDLDYIKNSVRRIRLLETDGDWNAIERYLETTCRGAQQQIERNFQSMSEEEREHFAKQLDTTYRYATDLLFRHPSENLANICFDNMIFKKGLLLQSNLAVKHAVDAMGDTVLSKQYSDFVSKKKELIARNSLSGLGNVRVKKRLNKEINDLDKTISSKCWMFRYSNSTADLTRKEIQKALGKDEVFMGLNESESGNLYALILFNTGNVKFVPISDVQDIKSRLTNDINAVYSDTSFADLIWKDVSVHIKNKRVIYYSTGGLFNQISIPALFFDNRYLCDDYAFKLVSNAKNVVKLKDQKHPGGQFATISLWGGVNYDYGIPDSLSYNKPQDSIVHRAVLRGDHLFRLPGSSSEVDAIAQMTDNPRLFKGDTATETSFKERSGKRDDVLHISTHGFFQETEGHEIKSSQMYNSGLFFAGANKFWEKDYVADSLIEDDGILRAIEIAELDFTNCKMAVLSACETGLGFSDSQEGVYGLQRAFKLAGVDKIMMSLWSVHDKLTKEFMVKFYRHIIVDRQTIDDAFASTQKEMKDRGEYPDCWAAFVLLD